MDTASEMGLNTPKWLPRLSPRALNNVIGAFEITPKRLWRKGMHTEVAPTSPSETEVEASLKCTFIRTSVNNPTVSIKDAVPIWASRKDFSLIIICSLGRSEEHTSELQ